MSLEVSFKLQTWCTVAYLNSDLSSHKYLKLDVPRLKLLRFLSFTSKPRLSPRFHNSINGTISYLVLNWKISFLTCIYKFLPFFSVPMDSTQLQVTIISPPRIFDLLVSIIMHSFVRVYEYNYAILLLKLICFFISRINSELLAVPHTACMIWSSCTFLISSPITLPFALIFSFPEKY